MLLVGLSSDFSVQEIHFCWSACFVNCIFHLILILHVYSVLGTITKSSQKPMV